MASREAQGYKGEGVDNYELAVPIWAGRKGVGRMGWRVYPQQGRREEAGGELHPVLTREAPAMEGREDGRERQSCLQTPVTAHG